METIKQIWRSVFLYYEFAVGFFRGRFFIVGTFTEFWGWLFLRAISDIQANAKIIGSIFRETAFSPWAN